MSETSELTILTVMGYILSPLGAPEDELVDRCTVAVQEMKKRQSRRMLLIPTGGDPARAGVTEAEVMARLMVQEGASAQDIIREDKAKNTQENAIFVMKIISDFLKAENFRESSTLIAVSSAYHLPFVNWCFRQIISIMKVNIKYECVAAMGAKATEERKIKEQIFMSQFIKNTLEHALKRTGLIKYDENIELEDESQLTVELEELLEKSSQKQKEKLN